MTTEPSRDATWPCSWPFFAVLSRVSAFVVSGDGVRTKLQKGEVGEREGGQVGSGDMNGMDFTTSSDRSLCSTQSTERAGRDSDDLGHWMSNQAEYHSHIGSFYRSADPHCSPWI